MHDRHCMLSATSRKRLCIQGYSNYSDKELKDYRFGIRFAYALCGAIVFIGLLFNNMFLLAGATVVALLGTLPPYHPFDYLYNHLLRYLFKKPLIPPRPVQGRFACAIATKWLSIT